MFIDSLVIMEAKIYKFTTTKEAKIYKGNLMETQISREQGEGGKFWIGDCPARAPFLLSCVGQDHKLFPKAHSPLPGTVLISRAL